MEIERQFYRLDLASSQDTSLGIEYFGPANPTKKDNTNTSSNAVALAIHGSIGNGRTFYSESGKGLAPFLANSGMAVYVANLRGRGSSRPTVKESREFSQTDIIMEDIPALLEFALEKSENSPIYCLCHSWGGILLMATLARHQHFRKKIRGIVFFGTKRRITVSGLEKFFQVDIMWNRVSFLIGKIFGYLPAKKLKMGADDESILTHSQCVKWVKEEHWIDPDGFNYTAVYDRLDLPPILSLAGKGDLYLGNPIDCQHFLNELGAVNPDNFIVLGKPKYRHDYNHISMMIHPEAPLDHFPYVLKWLESH